MKINVGIVKSIISNKIIDSFVKTGELNESKNISSKFFNVIKNSPYLLLEFNIINNLENKFIDNDVLATRYIDTNIRLVENYNINNIENEHNKLAIFIINNTIPQNKLYESIVNLIIENKKEIPNIDLLHESFEYVLKHIKTNNNNDIINEQTSIEIPESINGDDVINLAFQKFNEKYSSLNETELKLITKLTFLKQKKHQFYGTLKNHQIFTFLSFFDSNPYF